VLAPGVDNVSEAELMAHLATHFAKFQLPDRIVILPAIPKTSVGKFDKKVMRYQYAQGQLG